MLDLVNTVSLGNIGITSVNILEREKDRPKQILFHYQILT